MNHFDQVNYRLPVDLIEAVREKAKRENRYPAFLVTDAIKAYLGRNRRCGVNKRLPWRGRRSPNFNPHRAFRDRRKLLKSVSRIPKLFQPRRFEHDDGDQSRNAED